MKITKEDKPEQYNQEIESMKAISNMLSELTESAKIRVLNYVCARVLGGSWRVTINK
jgi:hypothetical protein